MKRDSIAEFLGVPKISATNFLPTNPSVQQSAPPTAPCNEETIAEAHIHGMSGYPITISSSKLAPVFAAKCGYTRAVAYMGLIAEIRNGYEGIAHDAVPALSSVYAHSCRGQDGVFFAPADDANTIVPMSTEDEAQQAWQSVLANVTDKAFNAELH